MNMQTIPEIEAFLAKTRTSLPGREVASPSRLADRFQAEYGDQAPNVAAGYLKAVLATMVQSAEEVALILNMVDLLLPYLEDRLGDEELFGCLQKSLRDAAHHNDASLHAFDCANNFAKGTA